MTTLSKEEYLKRYLSGDAADSKDNKKKKKKKTKEKASAKIQPRMRIIDNDADVPSAAVPPSGATVKKVSFCMFRRRTVSYARFISLFDFLNLFCTKGCRGGVGGSGT